MCSRLSLSILSVLAVATFAVIALPVGAQEGDVPKQDGKDAKVGHDAKPDESSEARTTPVGWPPHVRDRIVKAHNDAIAKAAEALDAIEKAKSDDATKAKTDLAMMMSRLRGTGLEQRAKDLLAEM